MALVDTLPTQLAAELARQYDILGLLGRGGMGTVYLARERSLDRQVAIKVLQGEAIDSAELRERFRREARIAARLVHPHIVPLHAFGETADALFFVMGYVDGETLAVRLDRDGRLGREAALRILADVADALAFAHREGVVHRDVKPENILLEAKSERALLADFGIARVEGRATSVTMTGVAVGTPSYMSPEQAAGVREIDGRSDIYALGIVGYRMLAGRLPFRGETHQALLAQHAIGKPDDLALVVAAAERGVARVIMRALEKDPAARWARAEDLRDSLRGAASDKPALPEELERIDGLGTALFVTWLVWVEGAYLLGLATNANALLYTDLDVLTAAVFALIPAYSAPRAARAFGWRETLHVMFHPPAFWSSWWPRPLRRADDLWDRLPRAVRRFRTWRDATILFLGGITVAIPLAVNHGFFASHSKPLLAVNGGLLISLTLAVAAARRARKVLMALGLSKQEASKVGALPNVASHPGWRNPQFMRVLSPERDETAPMRTPRTPGELARAIAELNDRLRRAGVLADAESAQTAESVRAAIAALDAEIDRLNRELDPAEADGFERRLTALGGGDEDAELRHLLEGQQALWRRLEQRRQEKEARRDRLRDQLVTLWMQMFELDARAAGGSQADPELTGRVRNLCDELAGAGEAEGSQLRRS